MITEPSCLESLKAWVLLLTSQSRFGYLVIVVLTLKAFISIFASIYTAAEDFQNLGNSSYFLSD